MNRITDMDCIKISGWLPALVAAFAFFSACKDPGPSDLMTLPAPTDLVLVYQEDETAGACLLFSWSPVDGASHYYVSLDNAESGSRVAEVESVTETGVLFQGVEGGVTYLCRVRAVNGYEYSGFAVSDNVFVPAPPEPEEPEDPDNPGTDPEDPDNPGTDPEDPENPGTDPEDPDNPGTDPEDPENPGTDPDNPEPDTDPDDTETPETPEPEPEEPGQEEPEIPETSENQTNASLI